MNRQESSPKLTWSEYERISREADVVRERAMKLLSFGRPADQETRSWIVDEIGRAREMRETAFQRTRKNTIEEEAAEQDRFGQPCRAELEAKIARQRDVPWRMRATQPMLEYSIDEAAIAVRIPRSEVLRAVILGRMRSTKTGRHQARILESEIADYMLIREVWPLVDKEMADDPQVARDLLRPKEWANYKLPVPAWRWDAMPAGDWEAPQRGAPHKNPTTPHN